MYFQQAEHNPPHIHAIYGINIQIGKLLEGDLTIRALKSLQERLNVHKEEILKFPQLN